MNMIRTFHSVGQGAFYTERFYIGAREINIVYDCGTTTKDKGKIIEREISNAFKKNDEIHALFISHLDADHINGIEYLAKYCNVKKIFFPIISSENRILLKLMLEISGADEEESKFVREVLDNTVNVLRRLVDSPIGGKSGEVKLIGVKEGGQREADSSGEYYQLDVEILESGKDVSKKIDSDLTAFWQYIPYNFRQNERITILKNKMKEEGVSLNDLEKWDGDIIDKMKEMYQKLEGKLNSNSMTLYSGPINQLIPYPRIPSKNFGGFRLGYRYSCKQVCRRWGCLYTGDYNANSQSNFIQLKEEYKEHWNNIGCIQIPHHGSAYNYNSGLIRPMRICIVSAGERNSYGHPHSEVLKDICLKRGNPYWVTENGKTRQIFWLH